MLRRLAVTVASGMLAAGIGLAAPGPAYADGFADCGDENGALCFWPNAWFGGTVGRVWGTNDNWRLLSSAYCGNWNDCASAIRNEGLNCEAVVYEHTRADGRGASWVINRDTYAADLSQWGKPSGGTWDNAISSNSWWCG